MTIASSFKILETLDPELAALAYEAEALFRDGHYGPCLASLGTFAENLVLDAAHKKEIRFTTTRTSGPFHAAINALEKATPPLLTGNLARKLSDLRKNRNRKVHSKSVILDSDEAAHFLRHAYAAACWYYRVVSPPPHSSEEPYTLPLKSAESAPVDSQLSPVDSSPPATAPAASPPPSATPDPLFRDVDFMVMPRSTIATIALSSEQLWLAAGHTDGLLSLWQVHTGTLIRVIENHNGALGHIQFSRDTTRLACTSNGDTLVFDTMSGRRLFSLGVSSRGLTYTLDGAHLLTASDGRIRFWSAATGEFERETIEIPEIASLWFRSLIVSQLNGQEIVTALTETGLFRFSVESAELIEALPFVTTPSTFSCGGISYRARSGRSTIECLDAAIAPDGNTVALSVRTDLGEKGELWNLRTKCIFALPDDLCRIAFSSDSTLLAGTGMPRQGPDSLVICDAQTGLLLANHPISAMVKGFLGREYVFAEMDGSLALIHPGTGKPGRIYGLPQCREHLGEIAFNPDGLELAATSRDNAIRVWNSQSLFPQRLLRGHTERIVSIAFDPDGRHIASASEDGTVRLWNSLREDSVSTIRFSDGHPTYVAFCPTDNLLVVGLTRSVVSAFDVEDLLSGRGEQARVWETAFPSRREPVDGLFFNVQGKALSVTVGAVIYLLASATGAHLRILSRAAQQPAMPVFSADGSLFAVAQGDRVVVFPTGSNAGVGLKNKDFVDAIALSPDGTLLLTLTHNRRGLRLWDARNGLRLHWLDGHRGHLRRVVFRPDGRVIGGLCDDGTLFFWETATGHLLATLWDFEDEWIALSSDGRHKYSGTAGRRFWYARGLVRWDSPAFLRAARKRLRQSDEAAMMSV